MAPGSGAASGNITIPMMTPVILYDLILGSASDCRSSPSRTSSPRADRPTRVGFSPLPLRQCLSLRKMGYASAMAWVLFVITSSWQWSSSAGPGAGSITRRSRARRQRWRESSRWHEPRRHADDRMPVETARLHRTARRLAQQAAQRAGRSRVSSLILVCALYLLPFYWMVVTALKTKRGVARLSAHPLAP